MPYLTTLGSTTRCNNNNRVQTGRVNKGYKNPYYDFVNTLQTVKTGKFVEKGGFTFKHDQNGLVGIDRQNKTVPQNATGTPQINIHMDLNELFNNLNQVQQVKSNVSVKTRLQPKVECRTPQQLSRSNSFSSKSEGELSKLKFAAADLIAFLKSKKTK